MDNQNRPNCDVCIEVPPYGQLPDLGEQCWEVVIISDGTQVLAGTAITLLDINAFAAGTVVAVPAAGLTILSSSVVLPLAECQVAVPKNIAVTYPVGIDFLRGNMSRVSDGLVDVIAGNPRESFRSGAKQCFDKCGWCMAIGSTSSVNSLAQPMGNGFDLCPTPAIENKINLANAFRLVWTTGAAFTPAANWTMKTTVRYQLAGTKGDCVLLAYMSQRDQRNACDAPGTTVRQIG